MGLPWLLPPSKSRSLPHQRGNTPYGLVAPSWPLCLPSNRCGSPNKNTTNPAPALFTGNASKKLFFVLYVTTAKEQSYLTKNQKKKKSPQKKKKKKKKKKKS